MIVRIDKCWAGGNAYYFRLVWHDQYGRAYVEHVENMDNDGWDRTFAAKAKDKVQLCCPNANRNSIRWHYGAGI